MKSVIIDNYEKRDTSRGRVCECEGSFVVDSDDGFEVLEVVNGCGESSGRMEAHSDPNVLELPGEHLAAVASALDSVINQQTPCYFSAIAVPPMEALSGIALDIHVALLLAPEVLPVSRALSLVV